MERKQISSYQPPEDDSDKKNLMAIIFLLLALVAAAVALLDHKPTFVNGAKTESKLPPPAEVNRIVNRHLKQTFHKMEAEKIRIMVENAALSPKVGQSIIPTLPSSTGQGVDMLPDRNEESVASDVDRSKGAETRYKLDHSIQGEIQDQDSQAEAAQAYRAEYARQFVENARQKGWEVQLDENYVVISVRPIKKRDASMQLFAPEGEGAR